MDVVPLGDHLRAHQQVDLTGVELVQHALKIVAGADGIAVQASNARLWKRLMEPLLYLFRSGAQKINVPAVAARALLRHSPPVTTIMAFQAIACFVEGKRDGAILSLNR